MDFTKYDKLKKLAPTTTIEQKNIGDIAAYKIALVSIVMSIFTLVHYIHYVNIKYSTTALARFFQFFIMFYIIFLIAIYFRYTVNDIVIVYFVIMSIPYVYYLCEYILGLTSYLTLNTVTGRIYMLTTFMTLIAIGAITNKMHLVAIILAFVLIAICLSHAVKIIGKMLSALDKE